MNIKNIEKKLDQEEKVEGYHLDEKKFFVRTNEGGTLMVVPMNKQEMIVRELHDRLTVRHQGVVKIIALVSRNY